MVWFAPSSKPVTLALSRARCQIKSELIQFKSLEDEFALARLFISARGAAGLTQQELAEKMKTSQAYIARLEGGREKPSTRTLNRFAKATGHRVVIEFEPVAT